MKKKTALIAAICVALCVTSGCGNGKPAEQTITSAVSGGSVSDAETYSIDYLVLVNKLNPLPDGWESSLKTESTVNYDNDEVVVEKKAYDAYLRLKADLEKEGIFIGLDSSLRTVAEQQRIMDEFTKEKGADYAAKTVATPGLSEHHTGLALDLYLIVDGKDIIENDDLIKYTDIWAKIHEKLPEYGFILRYLDDKEHITGYGYEPWHLRYIDDANKAKEITSKGVTLEEYLGAVAPDKAVVDYGNSAIYTQEELKEAAVQVKCKFAMFAGCELQSIRYAGDESCSEEDLKRMNELDKSRNYTQVGLFLTDFKTSAQTGGEFAPDTEIKDYKWWLARADGGWQLIDRGA